MGKLKTKLREKREKKASRNNVQTLNTQSTRHPNGKRGEQAGFPTKTSHMQVDKTPSILTTVPAHPSPIPHTHKESHTPQIWNTPSPTTALPHSSPTLLHAHTTSLTLRAHTTSLTPHVTETPPPLMAIILPPLPSFLLTVSQASPTTSVPTSSQASPPKLCPSDQDEYPLNVINKRSRRFVDSIIIININKNQIR